MTTLSHALSCTPRALRKHSRIVTIYLAANPQQVLLVHVHGRRALGRPAGVRRRRSPVMNSSVIRRSTTPLNLFCRRFSSASTRTDRRGDRAVCRSTPTSAASLRAPPACQWAPSLSPHAAALPSQACFLFESRALTMHDWLRRPRMQQSKRALLTCRCAVPSTPGKAIIVLRFSGLWLGMRRG